MVFADNFLIKLRKRFAIKNVSLVLLPIMEILDKILHAASELFTQYGFRSVTMDDVARRAGISKKTLYQHFANKNEVVHESVLSYQKGISENCHAIMRNADNAIQGFVQLMGMFDQVMRNINPMSMFELERYFPQSHQVFKKNMADKDVENVKRNIKWGMEEGLFRDTLDADFMARYRMELSMLMFNPNLAVNSRHDLQSLCHEVSEHFLYGIMTHKGEKLYLKYKEQYLKQVSNI